MLDLTQRRSSSSALLAGITLKRSGRIDGSLSCRLDLSIEIDSVAAADLFDQVVPGTGALYRRRVAGGEDRARLNRSPADLSVIAGLKDPESGDSIASVISTVERVSYVAAPKFALAVFQIRMAIEPSLLGVLAEYLSRIVEVSFATPQQVLPFVRRSEESADPDPVESGDASPAPSPEIEVVTFEASEQDGRVIYGFGQVLDSTEDEILVSDFGVEAAVASEHIVSRFSLVAPKAVQETYSVRARALGRTPSWADLIPAIGTDWSRSAESGEPLRLRDDHVRLALGADPVEPNVRS